MIETYADKITAEEMKAPCVPVMMKFEVQAVNFKGGGLALDQKLAEVAKQGDVLDVSVQESPCLKSCCTMS